MIASAWKKQDKTGDQSPEKGKDDNMKKKITFFFIVKKHLWLEKFLQWYLARILSMCVKHI